MDLATEEEERPSAIVQSYSRQSFATTFADNFWGGEGRERGGGKYSILNSSIENYYRLVGSLLFVINDPRIIKFR